MRDLVATKSLVYNTRRLRVGDYFTTRTNRDASVLVAVGKARRRGAVSAPPTSVQAKFHPLDHDKNGKKGGSKPKPQAKAEPPAALKQLRADYAQVVGKKPHHSWGEAELQRRIDEALAG